MFFNLVVEERWFYSDVLALTKRSLHLYSDLLNLYSFDLFTPFAQANLQFVPMHVYSEIRILRIAFPSRRLLHSSCEILAHARQALTTENFENSLL